MNLPGYVSCIHEPLQRRGMRRSIHIAMFAIAEYVSPCLCDPLVMAKRVEYHCIRIVLIAMSSRWTAYVTELENPQGR